MSIRSKIQSLISAANSTTGESDTTLTDAVQTLVDGYGQGGASNEDAIIQKTISGSYTNSNVTKVEQSIFYLCTGLTAVSFPNVTSIGYRGFNGCSNLVSADFPLLTTLGNEGFNACSKLETINMPRLSAIPTNGFSKTKIPAAFWPGKKAGLNAFLDCKSLATAVVGTTDYASTFSGCTALTAVDLTNNSGKIVSYCFANDALLTTLVIRGTSRFALDNIVAFNGTPFRSGGTGGTIYIPKALYDHLGDGSALDYQSATNWSTLHSRGTVTWAKIEGSAYENAYVDGTPMPTS